MQPEYLKAYAIFESEVRAMMPRLEALVAKSKDDLEGQLHALSALSACKYEA